MKKALLLISMLIVHSSISNAQIRLSSINVNDWVKKNFSGQGVVVGNITHKGYPLSILSFTSSPNVLQVPKGLILSSGNSYNVAGYNNSHNQSSTFSDVSVPEVDKDLSAMIKEKLFDVCSIEFDFVPMDNSIQFNYQFGSDEYPEYVDSPYNDIFAFIVSDETGSKNIALIPTTNVPVSINTVNFKTNKDHFIDNNLYKQVVIKRQDPVKSTYRGTFPGRVLRGIASVFGSPNYAGSADRVVIAPDPELLKTMDQNLYRNLRYDGITKKLVAQMYVTPYKKCHLKIVLADVSDNIYDSGVFIEDKSLTAKKDPSQPAFQDYPDLSKVIDPNLILQGKKLEEIIPDSYKNQVTPAIVNNQPLPPSPATSQPVPTTPVQTNTESPKPAPVKAPVSIPVLENAVIYFDFDKSDIKAEEMAKLKDAMARFQKLSEFYTFRITGHTDSIGSMAYNVELSKRRNQSVTAAVNDILGIRNLPAQPKSFTEPAADNGTDSGRAANRRVEIIFTRK
ncbi:choice-of-anchor L domain-containing protein [Daejeonella lutea]|uniref:Outer membrane protein OmpA n=1 Tax=Daejeonella lutea TaxID=572036 RepID=A0A1T5ERN2_9SPHI|nr:choice-of-anchor L domain-containing protein [Daejeonella lutea]SKB86607.1 Outer membrane protein OmpA [Daejeonella lutea]